MLKANERRIIPQIDVIRPNQSKAQFALHTKGDQRLVDRQEPNGGLGIVSIEAIEAAKTSIALDASDGKLDMAINGMPMSGPNYTIFWSNNSAKRMLLALANGGRNLRFNGRDVEVTQAFKQWVQSTMSLE